MDEIYSEFSSRFSGFKQYYDSLSAYVDEHGYTQDIETDIASLITGLTELKDHCNSMIRSPEEMPKNSMEYSVLLNYGAGCTDLLRKTEDLRSRGKSIIIDFGPPLREELLHLFIDLFNENWFRKYTHASDIEDLASKGIRHPFLQRGKHEKLLQVYMVETCEFDIMIYALLVYLKYPEINYGMELDEVIRTTITMIRITVFDKSDARMLKAAAVKYSDDYKKILTISGYPTP